MQETSKNNVLLDFDKLIINQDKSGYFNHSGVILMGR